MGHGFHHRVLCQQENQNRRNHQQNRYRIAGALPGNTAGDDCRQNRRQRFQGLIINILVGGKIPEVLKREDNQGQPGRLYAGEHDASQGLKLIGPVQPRRLQHRVRNGHLHELPHQKDSQRTGQGRQQQCPIGVDHMQLGEHHVLGDGQHLRAEQDGPDDQLGNHHCPGKPDFSQRISGQGGNNHTGSRPHDGHEQAVEDIPGKGHPQPPRHLEHRFEIAQRGAAHKKFGRKRKKLLDRFK